MIFSPPERNPENNGSSAFYKLGECQDCEALNATLLARIELLTENEIFHRNHFLGGRYENLYVVLDAIPEMRVILDLATAQAAHILDQPKKELVIGWWLNIMRPGDYTYPHTHDDADELLSGVYYIVVPPRSGKLLLTKGSQRAEVEPRAGRIVYFKPDVLHEVMRNESDGSRISIGFNVGPVQT
ncbi:MAG: 2OG-Fe(II) oxygenase family protein [Sulfuricaulis sp.]|nr:2OG-Fe(II) oxygenase family protein [Sulfuricaulis sp.]